MAKRREGAQPSNTQQILQISVLPISELVPEARNPRLHSDKHVRQIAASITTFGFTAPVLVDAKNVVIAGHGRLLAARFLDWKEVPVIRLEHLTPQQVSAYRICDNRLSECSEWDRELLGQELHALSTADLDFDLEAIGFELPQIDVLIQGLYSNSLEEEAVPVPRDKGPVVSVRGDLWHLGRHRLLCGNALEGASYRTLMGTHQARMSFVDFPYNVRIAGVSGNGRTQHEEFVMCSGEMTPVQFTRFLAVALTHISAACQEGALIYGCMDWRHQRELLGAVDENALELKNMAVWDKEMGGMGSHYRSQYELIYVLKRPGAAHLNNIQLGRFGRNRSNLWRYPGMNQAGRSGEEGNLLELHPTTKPVALVADTILDASNRCDIVLDSFAGSGTTLIAAEKTERVGYGMELDPRYVDTAVQRWQRLTGRHAIHAETGLSFEATAAHRAEAAPLEPVREESTHG